MSYRRYPRKRGRHVLASLVPVLGLAAAIGAGTVTAEATTCPLLECASANSTTSTTALFIGHHGTDDGVTALTSTCSSINDVQSRKFEVAFVRILNGVLACVDYYLFVEY